MTLRWIFQAALDFGPEAGVDTSEWILTQIMWRLPKKQLSALLPPFNRKNS